MRDEGGRLQAVRALLEREGFRVVTRAADEQVPFTVHSDCASPLSANALCMAQFPVSLLAACDSGCICNSRRIVDVVRDADGSERSVCVLRAGGAAAACGVRDAAEDQRATAAEVGCCRCRCKRCCRGRFGKLSEGN